MLSFLASLIIFAIILGAAYVFTKYFANKYSTFLSGKNLRVIESIPLGKDNHLFLVKAGEKYLLIGCSGKTMSCLREIDEKEIIIGDVEENKPISFKNYISLIADNFKSRRNSNVNEDNSLGNLDDFIENDLSTGSDDDATDYSFKSKLEKLTKNKKDV